MAKASVGEFQSLKTQWSGLKSQCGDYSQAFHGDYKKAILSMPKAKLRLFLSATVA